MTIETQIKALEYLKNCGIFPFSDTKTGIVFDDKFIDAAIETMRKYQKIEQIVKVWHQDIYAKDFECMAEIAEVLEDGNDD